MNEECKRISPTSWLFKLRVLGHSINTLFNLVIIQQEKAHIGPPPPKVVLFFVKSLLVGIFPTSCAERKYASSLPQPPLLSTRINHTKLRKAFVIHFSK